MAPRRPDPNRELLALIDLAYECATDPARWPVFLQRLTGATNSRGANLMVHDLTATRGAAPWQHGYDPTHIDEYQSWSDRNAYFLHGGHRLRTGVVLRGEDTVEDRVVVRTEFYNDYLRKVDTLHHLAACIFVEEPVIALLLAQRAIGQPSHSDDEKRLLETILPHVQRAIAIQRRLAGVQIEHAAAAEALDRLSIGLCLLDRRGRALLVNRAARAMLDRRDGLSLGALGVHAEGPSRRALEAAVARACGTGAHVADTQAAVILVERPSGRRALAVLVAPLRLRSFALASEPPAAVLLVVDPEEKVEGAGDVLARLFKLTPAEARVCQMVLDGDSAESIAERLGVTGNTARTHLKRVFSKTGTRGQSDLIRSVLGWAAWMRLPGTPGSRG